eukprot:Tamp_17407.p2 GENE.Tamp_17407~~Tamp_17407.p2  ORF type:complete len:328 (+),score=112.46 Tamp_17407:72-1055(+)
MDNQILLAGGVTAVVGVAVTAMWYLENNMGSSGSYTDAKKERNKKERGKKASQMKPKKVAAAQDAPAQRGAAPPAALSAAAPAPAPKAAAPAAKAPAPVAAPAKQEGKKKGKKEGKTEEEPAAAPAPTPPPPVAVAPSAVVAAQSAAAGKKKKNKTQAAPPAPVAPQVQAADVEKNGKKKKKDKAAQAAADQEDGWCTVGKGGKPKEGQKQPMQPAAVEVAPTDNAMFAPPDNSAAFFQVPVGAGGDFLEARVPEQGGKKKDKKKLQAAADLHTGSNGWSPATDAMVNNVARDLTSLTIAPSPVKKVAEEDEWNTVPVKSKKKSSKA